MSKHNIKMTRNEMQTEALVIENLLEAAKCVERVVRFGSLKHSPEYKKAIRGYETAPKEFLENRLQVDTLESTLAYIFSLPNTLGVLEACTWFDENIFHLRINDFDILAELFMVKYESNEQVGEIVIPFKGASMVNAADGWKHIAEYEPIKGGIRTERLITAGAFLQIGIPLAIKEAT